MVVAAVQVAEGLPKWMLNSPGCGSSGEHVSVTRQSGDLGSQPPIPLPAAALTRQLQRKWRALEALLPGQRTEEGAVAYQ